MADIPAEQGTSLLLLLRPASRAWPQDEPHPASESTNSPSGGRRLEGTPHRWRRREAAKRRCRCRTKSCLSQSRAVSEALAVERESFLLAPHGAKIDAQLLRFLIQMAA